MMPRRLLLVLLPLAAWPAFAAEGVAIRKTDPSDIELAEQEPPAYSVAAGTYRAEVFRTGRLRILAGKTPLFTNLVFERDRKVRALGLVRLEKDNHIVLREGAPPKKADLGEGDLDKMSEALTDSMKTPDLPGVSLHFLPDRIELAPVGPKPRSKNEGPQTQIACVFADAALAVRNLKTGVEDALPANRICSPHRFSFYGWLGQYWPDILVTYGDGTQAEVRGISGIAHYAIGRRDPYTSEALKSLRGYWALRQTTLESRISLVIRPADAKAALSPAPYATPRPAKPRALFYESERVLFHLDFAKDLLVPGAWQLTWQTEDHRQRPVGKGQQAVRIEEGKLPDVAVDLTPDEMGHFRTRLVLSRTDGKAPQRTHHVEFSRIRPECPKLRTLDGERGVGGEMLWANILGMRGIRLNPSWANNWRQHHKPDGTIDWEACRNALKDYLSPAREGTVRGLVSFTGIDGSSDLDKWFKEKYPDEAQRKKAVAEAKTRYLTEYARETAKLGVNAWEPINEPNLGMPQQRYIDEVLKTQYPAVKAGNPKANFLGGSICGLDNYPWMRRLYELGGHSHFDGTSFHPYTGLGFQEVYRGELDQWWQILRDHKDTEGGLWMTESAWHRGWGYQDYVYDRFGGFRQSQARSAVLMHVNAEALRIPRERIYVFYLVEHGYNDFYLIRRTWLTPAAVAIQVMNECLREAAFVREVPLPGKGHHFQLYRDAERTVAVAFTNDEPATLICATDATQVAATDLMGNRTFLKPANGRIRITITGDPTYLAAGPKNTLTPVYYGLQVQANLAIPTLGASAAASSVAKPKNRKPVPPAAAISGDWTCYGSSLALTGSRRGWDEADAGKDTYPDWFEVRLAKPAPVARVRVYHDYGAWERLLRDYDIQVHAAGAWKTVGSMRDNHYRFIGDHAFEPVATGRVRVLVHAVNSCLFENMQWIPRLSTLRAVEVYGPPAGPAKAFFVADVPRKRILAPGAARTLRFRVKNILAEKLAAELRVQAPKGVTLDPLVQKVELAPGAEAEFSVGVKLDAALPEGLYTVLAGLHQGDALVCADREPRVLCCKGGSR